MKEICNDQIVGLSIVAHAPFLAYATIAYLPHMDAKPYAYEIAAAGTIALTLSLFSRLQWLESRKKFWVGVSRISIMILFFATILLAPDHFTALHGISLATTTFIWACDVLTDFTSESDVAAAEPSSDWLPKIGLVRDEEEHLEIARFVTAHGVSKDDADTLSMLADMAVFSKAVTMDDGVVPTERLRRFKELLLAERHGNNGRKDVA